MRKAITLTIIFLTFCFLSGCAQKIDQASVIAKFDKQAVMAEELEKEISELPEWQQDKYKDQAGREEYLTLMAESRMLLQVANERGLDKDSEIVKQTKEYKDQLMVKELVKREVDDKVVVGDPDIHMYYEAHKADYVEPEKVTVTEITLEDESKAKETLEKIKGGADFTALAKEMSDKAESVGPGQRNEGKVTFTKDSFSQAKLFVDTTFSLQLGQITDDIIVQPIGDKTYYMIFRLDEHKPERQQELSEVESSVRSSAEREKKKEMMDKWLVDLKTQKKFQLFPERLPKVAEVKEGEAKEGEAKEGEVKAEKAEATEGEAEGAKAPAEEVKEDQKESPETPEGEKPGAGEEKPQ